MEKITAIKGKKFGDLFLPSLDIKKFQKIIIENLFIGNPQYRIIENVNILELISAIIFEIYTKGTPSSMVFRYFDTEFYLTLPHPDSKNVNFLGFKNFFTIKKYRRLGDFRDWVDINSLRRYIPNFVYLFHIHRFPTLGEDIVFQENTDQNRPFDEFMGNCLEYEFKEFLAQFVSVIHFARKQMGFNLGTYISSLRFRELLQIRRLPEKVNIPYPSNIYYTESNQSKPHFVVTDTLLLFLPGLYYTDHIENIDVEEEEAGPITSRTSDNIYLKQFIEELIGTVESRLGISLNLRINGAKRGDDQNEPDGMNILDYAPEGMLLEYPVGGIVYGCEYKKYYPSKMKEELPGSLCVDGRDLYIEKYPRDFIIRNFSDLIYVFRRYPQFENLILNADLNDCIVDARYNIQFLLGIPRIVYIDELKSLDNIFRDLDKQKHNKVMDFIREIHNIQFIQRDMMVEI